MNADAALEMVKRLMDEELAGSRFKASYHREILKNQRAFFRFLNGRDIREVEKKDLVEYHQHLCTLKSKKTGEPLHHDTIHGQFYNVCRLFSVMYRSGLIKENPCHNLKLNTVQRTGLRRRPLTRDEINEFLERLNTDGSVGLRDRALFELIYSSGLRVAEAASLKIEDVNLDRREIIVRGKGDRDRLVPISKLACAFLSLYLGNRTAEGSAESAPEQIPWIFPGGSRGIRTGSHLRPASISERFHDLLRKFGMDKKEISTHSIRHSTATHLLENGASVRHVQELLGHKNIETTVRYTHMQIDGLTKIYRKYHPREHELFEAVDEEYLTRLDSISRTNSDGRGEK
jgi:site-specific recombinase XerD